MFRNKARIFLTLLAGLFAFTSSAQAACEGENLIPLLAATPAELSELRAAAAAHPNAAGLFWRVEKAGTPPSYLFGTYHANEAWVATPPDAVAEAVRASRLLYVEVTPDEMALMQAELGSNPGRFLETNGGVLEDFLSPRQVEIAKKLMLEYGMPWTTARRLKPWFLQVQMAQAPCDAALSASGGEVLDLRLVSLARESGVEARGLETWNVAIGLFENQPVEDQRRGLMLALDMAGQTENLRRTALDLYRDGEVMMIWEVGRVASRRLAVGEEAYLDRMEREFWDHAVVRRNRAFVDAAAEELSLGGVVVAVGALHLPGRGGLVELLRAEGYTVTRLD